MTIAIDGNEANISRRVGSNAYAYQMLVAMEKLTQKEGAPEVVVLLARAPLADLPAARPGWQYRVFGPTQLWTQFALPIHLFLHQRKYNVFYTPGHYAPRISSVPYASSVMDLAFLHYPEQFRRSDQIQLKEWTRYSVSHAKKVIAISDFTKHDVMKKYKRKTEDVVVAYPAVTAPVLSGKKTAAEQLKKLGIEKPYFLYIGTLQPRKNLLQLIEAFERLIQRESAAARQHHHNATKVQLVIAGKVGWLADDVVDRIKNSPVRKQIIMTGYITEEEKWTLLQNALATILLGLYEGFGMPPLEGMAVGSIPIVSNTSSLPEVVGSAGFQVSPTHVKEITRILTHVLSLTAKERAKILRRGREQAAQFSWETSAQVVLNTLQDIATKKS